ncbi:MAG TPA: hypothetical protein VFN10_22050 [Thermoanaerobaculia bacterium]|nr:hypothetical protein [Thermoanaerobaculia bacterium]
MKKTSSTRAKVSSSTARASSRPRAARPVADDLREHYDFDYSKSRPNRFASAATSETVAIVLDADVAKVFRSSEDVNTFLRSAISAMPRAAAAKKRRAS